MTTMTEPVIPKDFAAQAGWDEKTVAQMEHLLAEQKEQERIFATLPESLPTITRFIMANDLRSAELRREQIVAGTISVEDGLLMTGSYGRLDLAFRLVDEGLWTRDALLDWLPENWTACDPDDADPRAIEAWVEAWERNGRKAIRDGKHLRKGNPIRVYRGQVPGAPIGCAWSLDRRVAEKFAKGAWARTSVAEGEIITLDVPRDRVLAYLSERSEDEIILDPRLIERVDGQLGA